MLKKHKQGRIQPIYKIKNTKFPGKNWIAFKNAKSFEKDCYSVLFVLLKFDP